MRADLRSELVIDALGMAVQRRRPNGRVIHHSDRGSQYTSLAFGKTLSDAGVLPSMGRRGDAFDNALMESFFATLETELIDRHTFKTRDQARLELFHYLEGFYNPPPPPLRARLPEPGALRAADDERRRQDQRSCGCLNLSCQRKRGSSTLASITSQRRTGSRKP